jgi:hypothetical protein
MPGQSIYDDNRLALPDEVWNFGRGDGIEKALLLADFIIRKDEKAELSIIIDHKNVTLTFNETGYNFESEKKFRKKLKISRDNYNIIS